MNDPQTPQSLASASPRLYWHTECQGAAPVELMGQALRQLEPNAELLCSLAQRFVAAGYDLYLVGGSVRDALLGKQSEDLDFTTAAHPEAIVEILEPWAHKVWDTGIAFGTISATYFGMQVEITTFRSDAYDGNSRNPIVQFGSEIEEDLVRRDFRINAIAVQVQPDGALFFHDPLQGLADLEQQIIDTPAPPQLSFHDDPLRMLRAARFQSQLGFALTPRVEEALEAMAAEIDRITVERIRIELDKLMLGSHPRVALDTLVRTGLAARILPELVALEAMEDEHQRHKDVYQHSLTVLEQAIDLEDNPDLVLRWAALLHDIGKPDTRSFNDSGRVTFHHHDVVGAKLARKRLRQLKYPKHMIQDISQLVYLHMRLYGFRDDQWTDSAVRRYVTDAGPLLPRLQRLVRADCTTRNKKKAARLQRSLDFLEERIAALAVAEDLAKVRPALNGNEIMQLLQLEPGPEVGKAWAFLKELRLEQGPMSKEEATAALQQWWEAQGH